MSATLTLHAIGDAVDVEQVAAVVGDQRVDEQDVGAEVDQLARQVAADEAEAAGDHHGAAAVELAVVGGHGRGELGRDRLGRVRWRGSGRTRPMLPADDQREPQPQHVDAGLGDRGGS